MRKTFVILIVGALFAAGACGKSNKSSSSAKGPTGPQTYEVNADAAAPQQIATYFPGVLSVRPGDTIVFSNKSNEAPHTITLGIKADNSNRVPPVTQKGEENPVAFGPCFTDTDPSPTMTTCPTPSNPASPPEFAGKGFWNSGVLAPAVAPTGNKITLKLASTIAPGDYSVVCLLHPFMASTLKVVAKDTDRKTPAAAQAEATSASTKAVADAAKVQAPSAAAGNVTTGYGDRIVSVNLFAPATLSVKVGDTVTWQDGNPYEPHTVTFKSPYKSPQEAGALAPHGDKSGGTYSGGFTSSGIIGPAPFFPGNTFSLKFAKAGTYDYICILHDGMKGTVTVTM